MQKAKIILLLFLSMNCAKKAPPPSPDRWAPRLRVVEAINRRHLRVVFSESVDPKSSLEILNYKCFEIATNTPLQILAATMRNPREIDLTTSIQSGFPYGLTVSGVEDLSGNGMDTERMEFVGSKAADIHPPEIMDIHPADGSVNFQPDSGVIVRFSEVMDTASIFRNCGLLPEGNFEIEWDDDLIEFRLLPRKLESGEVYSFYLNDGCKDIEGNRVEEWSLLTFTPDSTLPDGHVSGYLRSEERGTTMIALIDSLLRIVRIVLVSNSSYRIGWLKPANYTILAGMDLDRDRKFDLVAHSEVEVSEEGVIVELPLKREPEKWRIFERLETIFMFD